MDLSKFLDNANAALKRRNYAAAVQLFGKLCALQPDNGPARAGLRTALFKKAEAKPPSKVVALVGGGVHLLSAQLSRTLGQHAAAAKAYERYLTFDPLAEGANLGLASSLERAGHRRAALEVYRAYAEHQPRCLEASRSAGALLQETGEFQAAMSMYEQALRVDPRDQESLKARKNLAAEGALRGSKLETAESSRDLIKDQGEQKRLERADRLQLSAEEIAEELDDLEARLADNPDDIAVLRRLAQVHEMNNDAPSALDCLERALSLTGPDGDGAATLADKAGELRISLQERRIREAEARGDDAAAGQMRKVLAEQQVGEYRRRVERQPTDLGLRFKLGAALAAAESYDAAIAELQQAVRDPRNKVEALIELGRAFRAKGMADLARGQLEKALDAASASGASSTRQKDVLYDLAAIAADAGDTKDALAWFKRILEQDIGFRDVAQRVDALEAEAKNG